MQCIASCSLIGSAIEVVRRTSYTESHGGAKNIIKNVQRRSKVSVIVPVYNVESYLRECLDSIKNQTLKDIEIICVNDGSTDKSGHILDEYAKKDDRFIVIHQNNKGIALTRQTGMNVAKGEYMKFVDSDDIIDLHTCEICYNEAKKDDVDILVHGAHAFNRNHRWTACSYPRRLITNKNFNILSIFMWNGLYRTDFIKQNDFNFYGVCNMSEDQCFNMRCVPAAKRIKTIPNMLYNWRRHNTSLCATARRVRHMKDHFNNARIVYNHWKEKGYLSQENAQIAFLRWVLSLNYWPDNEEISKIFCDKLAPINQTILTNESVVNKLSFAEVVKLNKILKTGKKATRKALAHRKFKFHKSQLMLRTRSKA